MTLAFHRLVLVSLASLLLAGSADATSTTTTKGAIIKLDGGNSAYQFGKSCNFSKLKLGEQIAVVWKQAGNARVAVQVFVAM